MFFTIHLISKVPFFKDRFKFQMINICIGIVEMLNNSTDNDFNLNCFF